MKYKPGTGKVLVKLDEGEKTSSGGIILAEVAVEKPNRAVVMAVGNGVKTDDGIVKEITVKVDDVVLFNKGAGQKVHISGEEMLVLLEDDIYAVVEE